MINKGTMVLVGCVVGAGVLFYTSSGGSAARPTATATPKAESTAEIAHSGKTPKPASTATSATPVPTQVRLTLAQVRALPRPFIPVTTGGGGTGFAPPETPPAAAATETPAAQTPTATPTPHGQPPSEDDLPTQTPTPVLPLPTPPLDWWAIPTPPTLPPIPDGGLSPNPPSE